MIARLAATLSLAIPLAASALPPRLLWEATTPATATTYYASATDSAGNLVVAGAEPTSTGSCIATLKYAGATGAVLWRKTLCGVGSASAQALAVDRGDNVVITGTIGLLGGRSDVKTIKYAAADGAVLWDRSFDLGGGTDVVELGSQVAVDAADNVIVGMSSGGSSALLAKFAGADGAVMWQATASALARIAVDAEGNVLAAGRFDGGGGGDWAVTKHSGAAGGILWRKTLGLPGASAANYLALEADGSAIVTGTVLASGQKDMRTIKYAGGDGAVAWDRTFTAATDDTGWSVAVDGRGGAVVAGQSANDFKTIKYRASDGALEWQKSYGDPRGFLDAAYAIGTDAAGDVYVLGTTGASGSTGDSDIRIVKYASGDGAQLWTSA